jgi:hypothetical protein
VSVDSVDASVGVWDEHLGNQQLLHCQHHTILHAQAKGGATMLLHSRITHRPGAKKQTSSSQMRLSLSK